MLILFAGWAWAQEPATPPAPVEPSQEKLIVGTHPVAPFVVHEADGTWKGISIDLWDHIADELGIAYEIREYPVKELVENPSGEIDVAVSLNIAPGTERSYDMTHAFLSTGLGIAVKPQATGAGTALMRMLSPAFCCALSGVLVLLLGAASLMWAVEHRSNEDFGGIRGLWSGLLWAIEAVIGYGDPVHQTTAGRLLSIAWAGFGVIVLSALTAQLSSQLTITGMESAVGGPEDLPRVKVGTVFPSAGWRYCERRGMRCRKYKDAEEAVGALDAGQVDAIVYEAPILKYWASMKWPEVQILPGTIDNHGYGFGLAPGFARREEVNIELLQYIATDDFRSMMASYLGSALD
jgi:polar amino acid transport system substrate-binding protein